MMKYIKSIPALLLALIFLPYCKKSSSPSATLVIGVTDQYGNPITNYPAGLQVYLYTSKTDFGNPSKGLESAPTDRNGNATFPNLSPIQYYFYVEGACGSNTGSDSTTSGAISSGMTTYVSTVFNPKLGCIP